MDSAAGLANGDTLKMITLRRLKRRVQCSTFSSGSEPKLPYAPRCIPRCVY